MSFPRPTYIPWRERALVSYAEVAAIFDRSTSWVHDRLTDGSLQRARIPAGGSVGITVKSVIALMEAAPLINELPRRAPAARRRKHLSLVSSNS